MNKLLGLISMSLGQFTLAVEIVTSVQRSTNNPVLVSSCILIYGGLFLTTAWATSVAIKRYYKEHYAVQY